ncbi:MAG: hypothetical protein IPJ65_16110 [Archangiaceae bacterium]|nr:hypothetical protein [Archangiaceae bacterium]
MRNAMQGRKTWWSAVAVGAFALLGRGARAEPPDAVAATLEAIDGVLKAEKAARVEAPATAATHMGGALCAAGEPGAVNRDFLCEHSTLIGHWVLSQLRADGGQRVSAELEARRFSSPEDAQAAKVTALERYGGKTASISESALSWCYLDVIWTGEVIFSLWYGCGISLPHVKALGRVRAELLKIGEPYADTRIIGMASNHNGWSGLVESGGRAAPSLPDAQRFRHFVRVVGVGADDVLWLRERPQTTSAGAKIDKLPPDATCVPLVFLPPAASGAAPWAIVKFNGREGWVRRSFIAAQPPTECAEALR